MPYVFRMAGWRGGLFALLTFSVITWWTAILLGRELNGDPRPSHIFASKNHVSSICRLRKPINSFPAIARESFGQKGNILLSSVMYFELFSCLAVFLVSSLGDHLHSLFPKVSTTTHMMLASFLLMVATVFFKTPRLISHLSFVGTVTTVCVVLTVFATAIWEGDLTPDREHQRVTNANVSYSPYHEIWITSGLPIGFGLVAFCFSAHAVIPTIYISMEQPQQFEKMITVSFALVVTCCIAVAASGYYMFGSEVSDQITISLHDKIDAPGAMKALTWLMISTVFSKLSLYIFPLALGVEEIIACRTH